MWDIPFCQRIALVFPRLHPWNLRKTRPILSKNCYFVLYDFPKKFTYVLIFVCISTSFYSHTCLKIWPCETHFFYKHFCSVSFFLYFQNQLFFLQIFMARIFWLENLWVMNNSLLICLSVFHQYLKVITNKSCKKSLNVKIFKVNFLFWLCREC